MAMRAPHPVACDRLRERSIRGRKALRVHAGESIARFAVVTFILLRPALACAADDGAGPSLLGEQEVGWIKFAVSVFTAALLARGAYLRRRGRSAEGARRRDALLLVAGIIGALGWWNLLQFRYEPGFGHPLDIYHYYIGSKYFDELGYTRLYECTTVADAQSGQRRQAAARSIRNLETYRRESAAGILADPERCTRHFSPERWALFVHDVGWFRDRIPETGWRGLLADYGYNPSPAWGALAWFVTSTGPVSEQNLAPVLLIDPLLLIAMWAFAWKAFGRRATCVALVFWGTNLPGDYLWTGGGFLRQGWLVSLTVGISCLRLRWLRVGGFLLTTAALLRVFPALAIAALAIEPTIEMWRTRRLRLSVETRRFAVGCLAAIAILVPLSFANAGGPRAWIDFADNVRFHASTTFAANIGLDRVLLQVFPETEPAPAQPGERRPRPDRVTGSDVARHVASAAILAAYALLLVRAADRREDWEMAVLGAGTVVVVATMSSYYIGVLVGFGFLSLRHESIGAGLCAFAAFTWLAQWIWPAIGESYVWISLACVTFVMAAAARTAFAPPDETPSLS